MFEAARELIVQSLLGVDIGAVSISKKEYSFLSGGLIAGYQGVKNIYSGAEIFTSTDISSYNVVPHNEEISELNLIFGRRFYNRWLYLNLLNGIGYEFGFNRGKLLNTVNNDLGDGTSYYQKINFKSFCIPIEFSFGLSHFVGIGFKQKALLGKESYFGSTIEFSFGKLN